MSAFSPLLLRRTIVAKKPPPYCRMCIKAQSPAVRRAYVRAARMFGMFRMFPKMVRRDVIVLLCVKAAALTLIYFLFIGPAMHPEPNGRAVATHLLGTH